MGGLKRDTRSLDYGSYHMCPSSLLRTSKSEAGRLGEYSTEDWVAATELRLNQVARIMGFRRVSCL